jgi:uncharacterized protein YxjI
MSPKLIVEQKITALVNQYRIYGVDQAGNKAEMVAFAQQKRFKLKEEVVFYHNEQRTEEVFKFKAEKVFDVRGRYFVEDAHGTALGVFRKAFKKSLLNSTWHILDGDQPAFTVSESNKTLAVVRRIVSFIPYVDDLAEIIMPFIRYHFVFTEIGSGQEVGMYRKTKRVRDHYVLEMTDEAYKKQDWRVWAAQAVALDALQDR